MQIVAHTSGAALKRRRSDQLTYTGSDNGSLHFFDVDVWRERGWGRHDDLIFRIVNERDERWRRGSLKNKRRYLCEGAREAGNREYL